MSDRPTIRRDRWAHRCRAGRRDEKIAVRHPVEPVKDNDVPGEVGEPGFVVTQSGRAAPEPL